MLRNVAKMIPVDVMSMDDAVLMMQEWNVRRRSTAVL